MTTALTPITDPLGDLVSEVANLLHDDSDNPVPAARLLASRLGAPAPDRRVEAITLLLELLHSLLNADRYELAARLLWGYNLFDSRPDCTKRIWASLRKESLLLLQGASSMSKSYAPCVWLMLDWLRDPKWTLVICIGPKQQHLEDNVFSNLSRLHAASALPLPGEVGELFIGMDRRDKSGGIRGQVVPRGSKGTVLQGSTKAPKRDKPHPVFGDRGRVRVFLDELEDMPPLIHQDLSNVLAGIDFSDPDRLKIIGSYNPKYVNGKTAEMAEPLKGWDAFDLEEDLDWTSKKGWRVLRLDAHRSENVVEGKKIYGGLQTRDALDALRSQAGGEDSANYMTFGRGAFPRSGVSSSAVPQSWLNQSVGSVVWRNSHETHMGFDLAVGGDNSVGCEVWFGDVVERRWPGWADDPSRRLAFPRPRPCVFLRRLHRLPSGDNVDNARNVTALLRSLSVPPRNVNFDPGGPSGGAPDIIRHDWSQEIRTTWAGGGASSRRILAEDVHPANEAGFKCAQDEMWHAVRRLFEHGFIVVDEAMDVTERGRLFQELSSRLWRDSTMTKLESKQDYKRRNQGRSPDNADALALAVHSCRMSGALRPSVKDGAREAPGGSPDASLPSPRPKLPPNAVIFGDPDAFFNGEYGSSQRMADPTNDLTYL